MPGRMRRRYLRREKDKKQDSVGIGTRREAFRGGRMEEDRNRGLRENFEDAEGEAQSSETI